MVFCSKCGEKLEDGMAFCTKCGTKVAVVSANTAPEQGAPRVTQPVTDRQPGARQQPYQQAASPTIEGGSKINGWQYFINTLKKIAVFNGRARRAEFWWYILFGALYQVVITVADMAVGRFVLYRIGLLSSLSGLNTFLYILAGVVFLPPMLPIFALWCRRMHDINKRGWFALIPYYNLVLLFIRGTVGPNRFGPDPKQTN
jgi:uncharacterized membrane protein YhaH (DUF805 family)